MEMSEISIDDIPAHTPGHPPLPARPPSLTYPCGQKSFARWRPFCPPGFRKSLRSSSPTWPLSSERSGTLTMVGGWPTTAATAGRPWRREIWTGQSRTPASITRRLRGELGRFPDAPIVCRRTTWPSPAHATRTGRGLGGSPRGLTIEEWWLVVSRPLGANHQLSPVGVSTLARVGSQQRRAVTSTAAWSVVAPRQCRFRCPETPGTSWDHPSYVRRLEPLTPHTADEGERGIPGPEVSEGG